MDLGLLRGMKIDDLADKPLLQGTRSVMKSYRTVMLTVSGKTAVVGHQ
jgi:hypothetical protein